MLKRIIMSLGVIVFVGAVAYGSTGAFFSDSEISTGNTFTAGAIDLTVDSTQHYNGMICANGTQISAGYFWVPEGVATSTFSAADATTFNTAHPAQYPKAGTTCDGTWTAANLGAQKFFNFPDVKPGDQGENTISLHVDNNDAYACVDVSITENAENIANQPELNAGDTVANGTFDGELAQNLNFFAWADNGKDISGQSIEGAIAGDNIWQAGEPALFSNNVGPASDALNGKHYTLANSVTGPLVGGSTNYVGLAWCAGTLTAVNGVITCDGAPMTNQSQTDSMKANVAFRVEQARNNPNFSCTGTSAPTKLTLAKTVLPALAHPDSDFTLIAKLGPSTVASGIEGSAAVTAATIAPGTYTLSETSNDPAANSVLWQCIGNATPVVNNFDGTATLTVAAGESVGCDVTNNYNPIN